MDIGIIAIAAMAILGAIMFLAPDKCTRADRRDDPTAVAQVKKLGVMFISGVAVAVLMILKYS